MNRKISMLEIGALNYFIIRAFFVGIIFNYLIRTTSQDGWIPIILSFIPSIFYILFLNKFMEYEPNKNSVEKINHLFKKPFSYVFIFFVCILFFCITVFNFINLNNFIHSQFLNKTPIVVISIAFMISMFYMLIKGIHTITRTSLILFFMSMFLYIITFLGLLGLFKFDNLLPMFQAKIPDYFKGVSAILAYNVSPIILLSVIPKDMIDKKNLKKTLFISYFVSIISLFIVFVTTVGIFGIELCNVYEYPEFHILKNISLFGMSAKIDSILVIQWLFDMYVFSVVCIYFIEKNISAVININKKIIYFILSILIIISTVFVSKYNIFYNNIFVEMIHLFINAIFIGMIILVLIKLKNTSMNK